MVIVRTCRYVRDEIPVRVETCNLGCKQPPKDLWFGHLGGSRCAEAIVIAPHMGKREVYAHRSDVRVQNSMHAVSGVQCCPNAVAFSRFGTIPNTTSWDTCASQITRRRFLTKGVVARHSTLDDLQILVYCSLSEAALRYIGTHFNDVQL